MKPIILSFSLLTALWANALCSCTGARTDSHVDEAMLDSLPTPVVREVVAAVMTDDASRFASTVSYPLERPYPLRDVKDSSEMTAYYPVLVDDSLKQVIVTARPEHWNSEGWRGVTLHDGSYLWIDDKVYAVDYISKEERRQMRALASEEISSLEPAMRRGWVPVFCLRAVDNDILFRVDSRTDADTASERSPYRLAIYKRGTDLHGRPSATMRGSIDIEGSEGVRTYIFKGRDGSQAFYVFDRVSDDDPQQVVIVTASGDSSVYRVERAYWRDFLKQNPRK